MSDLNTFVDLCRNQSFALAGLNFKDILEKIEQYYTFKPTKFTNGNDSWTIDRTHTLSMRQDHHEHHKVVNEAGENNGSAKILYFGLIHNLSEESTLKLWVEHYHACLDRGGLDDPGPSYFSFLFSFYVKINPLLSFSRVAFAFKHPSLHGLWMERSQI